MGCTSAGALLAGGAAGEPWCAGTHCYGAPPAVAVHLQVWCCLTGVKVQCTDLCECLGPPLLLIFYAVSGLQQAAALVQFMQGSKVVWQQGK